MGRPIAPPPPDFAETYERLGWEARDALGMDTPRFRRCLEQIGRDDARRRRRNYVMGLRVSSLKLASAGV